MSSSTLEDWKSYRFPAALGFLAISLVYLRRREPVPETEMENADGPTEYRRPHWDNLVNAILLYCVPYNMLSTWWGKLHHLDIPIKSLRVGLFKLWTYGFGCNIEEADKDLTQYRNLSQFFTRSLKPGCREIDVRQESMVSPVDGRVYSLGSIPLDENNTAAAWSSAEVKQIKGKAYKLNELLGDFESYIDNRTNKKLNYIVLYLSPGDYHHYHSPHDLKVFERRHFPGRLFPVKKYFVENVPNLYSVNERVCLLSNWAHGFLGYVAVGAWNVGTMTLDFDEAVTTNSGKNLDEESLYNKYSPSLSLKKGEHVGMFNLGSTIVLVFESPKDFNFSVAPDEVVTVGQCLGFSGKEQSPKQVLAPPWPGTVDVKKE